MKKLKIEDILHSKGYVSIETLIVAGLMISVGAIFVTKFVLSGRKISDSNNKSITNGKNILDENKFDETEKLVELQKTSKSYKDFSFKEVENHPGYVKITGYSNNAPKDVVIPDKIDGKVVVSITPEAFSNLDITSVKIPNSVKYIGYEAFSGNKIKTLNLPKNLMAVSKSSFDDSVKLTGNVKDYYYKNVDGGIEILGYLGKDNIDLTLPSTIDGKKVVAIGWGPFYNSSLNSVTIPDTVTQIGYEDDSAEAKEFEDFCAYEPVFRGNKLKNIKIPNSLEIVGEGFLSTGAFGGKYEISYLNLPNSVKFVSKNAFDYSANIDIIFKNYKDYYYTDVEGGVEITGYFGKDKDITIPSEIDGKKVVALGNGAFKQCALTSVKIPNTVKSIGSKYGILSGTFERNCLRNISIPDSVTYICESAFEHNLISTIKLPNGITSIGDSVFSDNVLEDLSLPDSIKEIGERTFAWNHLKTLKLPNSITKIGEDAFEGNELRTVNTKEDFKDAFDRETKINSEENKNTETDTDTGNPNDIKNFKYRSVSGGIEITGYHFYSDYIDLVIPSEIDGKPVVSIANWAISEKHLTNVVIPDTVEKIGERAFDNNELKTVKLGNSVKSIGRGAFAYNSIDELVIPDSVEHIGDAAFASNSIKELKLGKSLKTIGDGRNCSLFETEEDSERYGAFEENTIQTLIIPDSVEKIGESAFANNYISELKLGNSLKYIENFAFSSNFISDVVFPNSIKAIEPNAFNHNELMSATLPNSLDRFYEDAFEKQVNEQGHLNQNANGFSYKDVDGGVEIIGYTGKDRDITIPSEINGKHVVSIGYRAFYGKNLSSVVIPNTVTHIGEASFQRNDLQGLLTIPDSVTTIDDFAFYNNSIEDVNFGKVKKIGHHAFGGDWYGNNINRIGMHDGVSYESDTFYQTVSVYRYKDIDGGVEITGYENDYNENINIPSKLAGKKVVSIGSGAFYNKALTRITIPDSVEKIGTSDDRDGAFEQNKLTEITIPDSVKTIGKYAFYNNRLTDVTMGKNVEIIGGSAFRNNKLKKVTIPNKTILNNSFDDSVTIEKN